MPALDALQKEKGGADFEVVAINVDTGDDTKPRKFLAETDVQSLAYYRDSSLDLFNDLKTRGLALGLPVTLLIDKEGCLRPASTDRRTGRRRRQGIGRRRELDVRISVKETLPNAPLQAFASRPMQTKPMRAIGALS